MSRSDSATATTGNHPKKTEPQWGSGRMSGGEILISEKSGNIIMLVPMKKPPNRFLAAVVMVGIMLSLVGCGTTRSNAESWVAEQRADIRLTQDLTGKLKPDMKMEEFRNSLKGSDWLKSTNVSEVVVLAGSVPVHLDLENSVFFIRLPDDRDVLYLSLSSKCDNDSFVDYLLEKTGQPPKVTICQAAIIRGSEVIFHTNYSLGPFPNDPR